MKRDHKKRHLVFQSVHFRLSSIFQGYASARVIFTNVCSQIKTTILCTHQCCLRGKGFPNLDELDGPQLNGIEVGIEIHQPRFFKISLRRACEKTYSLE